MAHLAIFPKQNKQALIAAGKKYGLVTPGTSLIVLESLEQYLQHDIAPPKSLPKMHQAYLEASARRQKEKQQKDAGKMQSLVRMWAEITSWHRKDFVYKRWV